MGELVVVLFLGFFALLAAGALVAQVYGLTGRHERRRRGARLTRLHGHPQLLRRDRGAVLLRREMRDGLPGTSALRLPPAATPCRSRSGRAKDPGQARGGPRCRAASHARSKGSRSCPPIDRPMRRVDGVGSTGPEHSPAPDARCGGALRGTPAPAGTARAEGDPDGPPRGETPGGGSRAAALECPRGRARRRGLHWFFTLLAVGAAAPSCPGALAPGRRERPPSRE